jgi:hypothetical protein
MRSACLALALASCYAPSPVDGAFRCLADLGGLCPMGLQCDPSSGLCVHRVPPADLATVALDLPPPPDAGPPGCDERVRAGRFANAVNLSALNSSGNEGHVALSADGTHLYFLSDRGGSAALYTAPLAGATSAQAVTLAPGSAPAYTALGGVEAAAAQRVELDAACGASDVLLGAVDRPLGAFSVALASSGWGSPSLLPGGRTLVVASLPRPSQLAYAVRAAGDVNFGGPTPLPLDVLGGNGSDEQLVVTPDCSRAIVVSSRAGGAGGTDLWSLDIQ